MILQLTAVCKEDPLDARTPELTFLVNRAEEETTPSVCLCVFLDSSGTETKGEMMVSETKGGRADDKEPRGSPHVSLHR